MYNTNSFYKYKLNNNKILKDTSTSKYGTFSKTNTDQFDKSLNTLHNFKHDSLTSKGFIPTVKTMNYEEEDMDYNLNKNDSMFGNMTTTIGDEQFKSMASLNASRRMLWRRRIDCNFNNIRGDNDRGDKEKDLREERGDNKIDDIADAMGMGRM